MNDFPGTRVNGNDETNEQIFNKTNPLIRLQAREYENNTTKYNCEIISKFCNL